jgi:HSP20 family protein
MFSYWTDLEWDRPFDFLEEFRRRMDRFMEGSGSQWPTIQMNDVDKDLIITADLPGVKDSDVNITVQGDMVTITAKREPDLPHGYTVHREERQAFEYTRSFSLPCPVQQDKIDAQLKNGLLMLRMPKAAEAKPRQVSIKAA